MKMKIIREHINEGLQPLPFIPDLILIKGDKEDTLVSVSERAAAHLEHTWAAEELPNGMQIVYHITLAEDLETLKEECDEHNFKLKVMSQKEYDRFYKLQEGLKPLPMKYEWYNDSITDPAWKFIVNGKSLYYYWGNQKQIWKLKDPIEGEYEKAASHIPTQKEALEWIKKDYFKK